MSDDLEKYRVKSFSPDLEKYRASSRPTPGFEDSGDDPIEEKEPDTLDALSQGVMEGTPIIGGLLDEGYGLDRALFHRQDGVSFGDTYRAARDFARSDSDRVQRLMPKTKFAGEIAAGIAAPSPLEAVGAVKGIGKLLGYGAKEVAAGGSGLKGVAKLVGLGAEEAATRSNAELTGDNTQYGKFAKDTGIGAGIAGTLGGISYGIGKGVDAISEKVDWDALKQWLLKKSNQKYIGALRLPQKMQDMLTKSGKADELANYAHDKGTVGYFDNAEDMLGKFQAQEPAAEQRLENVYGPLKGAQKQALQDYVQRRAEIRAAEATNAANGPRTRVEGEAVVPGYKPQAPRPGSVDAEFSNAPPPARAPSAPVNPKAVPQRPGSVDANFRKPFDMYYSPGGLPDHPVPDLSRSLGDGIAPSAMVVRGEQGLDNIIADSPELQNALPAGAVPPGSSGVGPSNQIPVPESLELPPMINKQRLANRIRKSAGETPEERAGSEELADQANRTATRLESLRGGRPMTLEELLRYRSGMGNKAKKAFNGQSDSGSAILQNEMYGKVTDTVKEHADELAQKYAPDLVGEARAADKNYSLNMLGQDLTSRADAATKRNRDFSLTDYISAVANPFGGAVGSFASAAGNKFLRERGGTTASKLYRKAASAVEDGINPELMKATENLVNRALPRATTNIPSTFIDYLDGVEKPSKEQTDDAFTSGNGGGSRR